MALTDQLVDCFLGTASGPTDLLPTHNFELNASESSPASVVFCYRGQHGRALICQVAGCRQKNPKWQGMRHSTRLAFQEFSRLPRLAKIQFRARH